MADISAKQLGLRKSDLPHSIIEVISTLTKAGFEAYIVGGGVRDNLLGLDPKDFDAVTNAKPHEIKDVFGKRCRIIGRRFQLAHVYSGREMIEVATFRAPPKGDSHTTDEGMVVRDNVWGDIQQDAKRRDFSINAMYYQPIQGVVKDFCHANDDIESKTLRLLGDAKTRIEEDPVRLLRALRFKAKLGFEFDDELAEQFNATNWALLEQVSPHRLYDETNKMFTGGYVVPLLPLLYEYGAMEHLFYHAGNAPSQLVAKIAYNTDKRIISGRSINPAFFYAGLLWNNYLHQLEKNKKRNMTFDEAQKKACAQVINRQRNRTAIPRFAEQFIKDTWLLQPRLANPSVKNIIHLSEHPRFRAGYDFLKLREQCGENDTPLAESTNGMGQWWQHFQTLSEKEQNKAIKKFIAEIRSTGRKRKGKESSSESNKESTNQANEQLKNQAKQPPKTAKQAKQDSQEKAQLQMLSLAMQEVNAVNVKGNTSANSNNDSNDNTSRNNQPSPLFTVEFDSASECESESKQTEFDSKATAKRSSGNLANNSVNNVKNVEKDATQKISNKANPQQTITLNQEVTPLQALLLESERVPRVRIRRDK